MNPLYRRMFQQPGMSRQPMGILASSPELANVAAQRQPVRMAQGGLNSTTFTAAVQRAVQNNDKYALQELAKPANYGEAAKTQDGQNAIRMATQALGAMTEVSTKPVVESRSLGSYINQGIAAAKDIGRVLTTPINDLPMSNLIASGQLPDELTGATSSKDQNVMDGGAPKYSFDGMSSQENLGRGYRESNLMGTQDDAQFFGPGEQLSNLMGTKLDQQFMGKVGSITDDVTDTGSMPLPKSKPDRNEGDFDWPSLASEDPVEAMNIVADAQSEGSNKEKAKKTDDALGIKGTLKERMMQRRALIREMLGEDKAKDIRTDANYNLMMTGLMIAAGQSEDALTNIATGLAKGLKGFGEAKGEEAQAERKLDRETALLAYQDITAEDKAAAERQFQADEAKKKRDFQAAENALSRLDAKDRAKLGADTQIKIAELSDATRKSIAELSRDNQMAIAQLPSKEIQGLLQVFGDNEGVKTYLEAKNKTTKLLQGSTRLRGIEDILKNEKLMQEIIMSLPESVQKDPDKLAQAMVEAAGKIRTNIEAAAGTNSGTTAGVTVLK